MTGTFTQFVKKNETEAKKENFAIKIVDMCNYMYNQNKSLPPEELLGAAIREVLNMETAELEKRIETASGYIIDIVRQKFPQVDLINTDINQEGKK